jgi:hypothetical protein
MLQSRKRRLPPKPPEPPEGMMWLFPAPALVLVADAA